MEIALEVRGIGVRFGDVEVLRDVARHVMRQLEECVEDGAAASPESDRAGSAG